MAAAPGAAFSEVLRNTPSLPAFSFNNLSSSSAMDPYRYEPNTPQKSRMDQVTEMGQQGLDEVSEAATVTRDTVKEHPIITLAVVGGLAFAVGALWKLQRSSKASHVDTLMERLSDLQQQLPKRWRA